MNGKKARALRKQAGFHPAEFRGTHETNRHYIYTGTVQNDLDSSRRWYQDLKKGRDLVVGDVCRI